MCLGIGYFGTWDSSGPLGALVERYALTFGTLLGETGSPMSSLPFEAKLLRWEMGESQCGRRLGKALFGGGELKLGGPQ